MVAFQICVDEKAFRKAQNYVTIVYDPLRGSDEYIANGRTTQSLRGYFQELDKVQLEAPKSVSIDMWPAYLSAAAEQVPASAMKIVIDRVHVMKKANEAVGKVRKLRAPGAVGKERQQVGWDPQHLALCGRESARSPPRTVEDDA